MHPTCRQRSKLFTAALSTAAFLSLTPLVAMSQTLNITSGIQSYTSLNNTAVTMSGQCELHLTATNNLIATNNPMPGCAISLNSSDAWLFLDNTRPSIVLSMYLPLISVNGASADTTSNVRVTEYGMGSIVIPEGPSFQPLTVFSGSQFSGGASNLTVYTFYQAANGNVPFNGNIGSFILKRGYMATIGRQSDSRFGACYVAQEGDLKIGALPAKEYGHVGFIRVMPWNEPSKKGWAGGNDSNGSLKVDPIWNYDWNNGATSTADVEYSPIRQNGGWPDFNVSYNKQGSTHFLGFNEPDSSSQANMTVEQALQQWPLLMQSGLRIVTPATTDGGKSWLYSFTDQIRTNGNGLRFDAAAIHMYMCGQTSSSLQSWLADIHNRTHRNVWVTEFNNGANWTTCTDPTYDQEASTIQSFISMMDSQSFMERYAVYQWVETVRMMVTNDASGVGVLTPAGTNYLHEYSPRAYPQDIPAGAGPDAIYVFDGDSFDQSGAGNNALLVGDPIFIAGHDGQALQLDGVRDYAQLPAGVGIANNFTFAAWVNWNGGADWQRIFDIGLDSNAYLFLTPSSAGTPQNLRFAISTGGNGGEQRLNGPRLTPGTWTHVAVTLNGSTGKLFVNGSPVATNTFTLNPKQIDAIYSYLGKSQFAADPLFAGTLDDVFFAGYAYSDAQVAALASALPTVPAFNSDPITATNGVLNQAYADSIAADATGTGLTFSKADGPSWLNVASNGALSGTPGLADVGPNVFHVRVVNSAGDCDNTRLTLTVTAPSELLAAYPFDGSLGSSTGLGGGTLTGTATYGTGQVGQALVMDGSANYIKLPNGVGNVSNFTIAAWVNWAGGGNWQRIFDFGNGQGQYMFLTPSSGSGTLRFAIKNTGSEQSVETSPVTAGQWTHVAVTLNGTTASLYVNGTLAATAIMTIHPSDFEPMVNYIGKSQYSDPLFHGSLDEFRIYNYALSATDIASLASLAPAAPTGLGATGGNAVVNLNWTQSTSPGITQNNVYRSTSGSGGPYNLLTSLAATTAYADNAVVNGSTYYYTVSAVNGNGESAMSAYAGATPSGIPAAPSNLTATAGRKKITLGWTDNSSNETGFSIERSTDNVTFGQIATTAANSTGYTNSSLTTGATYYYRVRATNGAGNSPYSNTASATSK